MIDLIIPVYNNYDGLMNTLQSIDFNCFNVTVVDDHSKDIYYVPYSINLIKLEKNVGPGWARQIGIWQTNNDYIAFIDSGDVFISNEVQYEIVETIKENPNVNIFYWTYFYKDKETDFADNRLHGKVYKREFLNKYNITFCKEGSYMNEDIGFNRACRIISNAIDIPIKYTEKPVIKWITDEDSITQKDNNVSLYRDQTRGLSINSIHSIEICRKNGFDVLEEINEIALSLYYWFIRTAAERPQYIKEAWNGAKIFYTKYTNKIEISQIAIGSTRLRKCLMYKSKLHFPINIIRFYHDIISYKNIPAWYTA